MATDGFLSATGELCVTGDSGTAGDLGETEEDLSDTLSRLSSGVYDLLFSNSLNGFDTGERDRKGFGLSDDAPWNGFVGGRDLDSVGDNLDVVNRLMKGLFEFRTGGRDSCGDFGDCGAGLMTLGDRHGAV